MPVAEVTAERTSYPLSIDNCGHEIVFEGPPERVLILNGASVGEVESLIALGLSERILANSQSYGVSDDPAMVAAIEELPTGGLSLNENFEVPREQVLALEPDLVMSTWAGGFDSAIGAATRDQLDQAGINSYVTPVNCAFGAANPRPADQAAYEAQSVESSFEFLLELGVIFDVQHRAVEYVQSARAALDRVSERVGDGDPPRVLVAFPSMAAVNSHGLPAVFGGGIYDDIIERAGGTNVFAGASEAELAEINAEAFAAAEVDVLVIGVFQPDEDHHALAAELLGQFPNWPAAQNDLHTWVSDSIYIGPLNALAVERIADAAHAAS